MSDSLARNVGVAQRVVAWQAEHGRNHLPWQQTRDPYRVWLSEIMLQQTQVTTVLDYYSRFLERFPDVAALAAASADEVMALWSGLGYYSRARNLHRCAQAVVQNHGGAFPASAEQLATLPGIGRSTAGAIAAFCFSERVAILDANVRRVLTRLLGFGQDLSVAKNERLLWDEATRLLPDDNLEHSMPRYTQGLMDLGATVCSPKSPQCERCPLQSLCVAAREGEPQRYPVKTRKLARRAESWYLLILESDKTKVWLERRPASGIWAGLYCPPTFEDFVSLEGFAVSRLGAARTNFEEWPAFLHVLTHRDLHLHPVVVRGVEAPQPTEHGRWFDRAQWDEAGLPAPVRKFLDGFAGALMTNARGESSPGLF